MYKRLTNRLSSKEEKTLEGYLQQDPKRKESALLDRILAADDPNQTTFQPNVEAGLARLKNRIAAEKEVPVVPLSRKSSPWLRIAAALVFLIVAGTLLWQQLRQPDFLQAQAAAVVRELNLADGTTVWLNADSELDYPQQFEGDLRSVYLKGEAYFDVASNPEKPFVVYTPSGYVKVLGTEFIVQAREDSPTELVQVYEGLVEYSIDNRGGKAQLKAGTGAQYNKAQQRLESTAEALPENLIAWKTGQLFLKGETLGQILDILSAHFAVRFDYDSDYYEDCVFTFTADAESLENSLLIIEKTQGLQFEKTQPGTYKISGQGCN
ncbi:MAG: FecR domain-containing protein [Phaeodactylibacter sp.]|nr:FecR domain-containing protein [Phaeodactylibacter sp.]